MLDPNQIAVVEDVCVLRLNDPSLFEFENITSTTYRFEAFFEQSPKAKTLINFNQIEFWNSVCLGLIAGLKKKAARHGRTVSLCNLNPKSLWAMQATRLHEIFDVYEDESQALAAM